VVLEGIAALLVLVMLIAGAAAAVTWGVVQGVHLLAT
jgi:hypothetical protein